MTDLDAAIHELGDWLRIPSVSTAGGDPEALREAAEWALRRVLAAGGTGELVGRDHPPLVVAGPPEPLRAGLQPPSPEELDAWAQLPPGDRIGSLELGLKAARELYEALASVD